MLLARQYSVHALDDGGSARVEARPFEGAMVQIAHKIIEQQEGPFDPEQFTDRYEEALRAMIAAKRSKR